MRAGYEPESFWDQTARTLSIAFEAHAERTFDRQNERLSLAWHIAALSRVDAKKFPKHDKLMRQPKASGKRQTQAQQMNIARLINARVGGRFT